MRAGPGRGWRRIPAVVEWRSEWSRHDRPQVLRRAGERIPLEVVRQWVEAGPEAGDSQRRVFIASAGSPADPKLYRITLDAGGRVTVEEGSPQGVWETSPGR